VLPIKMSTYGLSPSTRFASTRAEKLAPHVWSSLWFDLDLLTSYQDDHQVVCGVSQYHQLGRCICGRFSDGDYV
jgi:hypothetical protein